MDPGARIVRLAAIIALCAAAVSASAAPGFVSAPVAGASAPAPRMAPMRPPARFGHVPRGLSGLSGYPGLYGWSGERTVIVLPEASEPPAAREPSIPVAIGIPRPPAADPVLYRIETYKGRPVVRSMRFGSDGRVARR